MQTDYVYICKFNCMGLVLSKFIAFKLIFQEVGGNTVKEILTRPLIFVSLFFRMVMMILVTIMIRMMRWRTRW